MKKMPRKVYVRWNQDGNDDYLEIQETTDGWEHGDKVGIFELKETRTLVIKSELVK